MSSSTVQTQLPDGRWVDAQPIPFMACTTPWWKRAWLAIRHWRDTDEYEDSLDWVAMELSAKERGMQVSRR